jgi:uncharacterized protein YlxW (UPF0749 family)
VQRVVENKTFFIFWLIAFGLVGYMGQAYYTQHVARFNQNGFSTAEILRTRSLMHQLQDIELNNATLASELAELHLKLNSYQDPLSYLWQKEQQLRAFMGQLALEGPGLELTLQDNTEQPFNPGQNNPNDYLIHNTDLVSLVNELRGNGAQDIAINGHRIVFETVINCSGPIVLINGSRVASPFVIQAIGSFDDLSHGLSSPTSSLSELKQYGIQAHFQAKLISLPPYTVE